MRICITSWHAGPLVDPGDPRPVGGAETRAWTFAQGLARLPDMEVHLAVRARGRILYRSVDGVHVWNLGDGLDADRWLLHDCVRRTDRFPGVAFRRWDRRLWKSLPLVALARLSRKSRQSERHAQTVYEKVPADVHLAFGVSSASHLAMQAARRRGVPFAVAIAAQAELDPRLFSGETYRTQYHEEAADCREVLQGADLVIVQTEQQQQWVRERLDRHGIVIANPVDLDSWDRLASEIPDTSEDADLPNLPGNYVLWVGRAESVDKRPELAYELARRLPDVSFVMVLNPSDAKLESQLHRERPVNVTVLRSLPFTGMPRLFRNAEAFVSTSATEGFPNTFLQAAASRVPIASLEVGADWLVRSGGGFCAEGDMAALVGGIRQTLDDSTAAAALGEQGRRFVERHHAVQIQSERLAQALSRAVDVDAKSEA